jgi:uncharacterized protein (TIGR00369 family)
MIATPPLTREQLDAFLAASPYIRHWQMFITGTDVTSKTLTMRMPWRTEAEGEDRSGSWHGGPIAALADTAGCFAAIMVGGRNAGTLGLNIDYVRPASGAFLEATARVRKAGRAFSTVEVDIADAVGKLVAVARGTFFFNES